MTGARGSSPQQVRFCRAPDGVRIAYAVHGNGPPLVVSTCWLSHLQYDWDSPVWRHFLDDIGRFATVVRFDERGHGLSDWDVTDHSLPARLGDLEAVVEAAGYDRFALMAMAQGGPVAISYTAAHPERVDRLVFYGSYSAATQGLSKDDLDVEDTFGQMIKVGWGREDSTFRRVFTSLMIPGATEEQMRWVDDLQRVAASATTAYLSRRQRFAADADHLLGDLDLPVLVAHSRGDRMNHFAYGRHLATGIRGAELLGLDSDNHIVLGDEPAWPVFVAALRRFLVDDDSRPPPLQNAPVLTDVLSARELDVLRAASEGLDNEAIAARLHLSVRTVERHLQNVYGKLGLRGRSARTAAVARLFTPA